MPESRRRRGRPAMRGARSGNPPTTIRRRKTNIWYLAASIIIAVLVIVSFGLTGILPGGGGSIDTGSARAYVEGVGVKQELMLTRNHVVEPETVEYSTEPPTSGDHWDIAANCGYYPNGAPNERTTHNLEHGNIVISHNLTNETDIELLREAVDDIGLANDWGILRYYPEIPSGQIALATWGVLDTMESVDKDRIEDFFETYAGALGPEFVPCTGAQIAMPSSQP